MWIFIFWYLVFLLEGDIWVFVDLDNFDKGIVEVLFCVLIELLVWIVIELILEVIILFG